MLGGTGCLLGAAWFAHGLPALRQTLNPIFLRLGIPSASPHPAPRSEEALPETEKPAPEVLEYGASPRRLYRPVTRHERRWERRGSRRRGKRDVR